MKNKKLVLILCVVAANCIQAVGYAAEIKSVSLSDFDNSILTVSGCGDESGVTVYAVPAGETFKAGLYNDASEWSIQHADTVEGEFSVSFKLQGKEGIYDFYVSGAKTPYSFEYISKDTIVNFVEKLGNKEIAKEDIFELLKKYSTNLGIDLTFVKDKEIEASLSDKIYNNSNIIKEKGISGLTEIVELSRNEFEFLDKLKNTEVYSSVNILIEEYCEKINIDVTEYNKLSDYKKQLVCKDFVNKEFNTVEDFLSAFNKSVSENSKPDEPSSPGSSSGGMGKRPSSGNALPIPSVDKDEDKDKDDDVLLTEKFEDLDSVSWAWDAILYMCDNNIMNGVSSNKFAPNNSLTREQLAKLVVIAFDCDNKGEKAEYSDVPQESWAAEYISAAKNSGLMLGLNDELFGYGKEMTRQDLCVAIYRAALKKGLTFTAENNSFDDFDEVSDYAKEAVSKLSGAGIINGVGNNKFSPKSSVTRAQSAKIFYEILANYANK